MPKPIKGSGSRVDAEAILNAVKADQSDRQKVSLYLSKVIYEEFKSACGEVPASSVVEKLMLTFTGSRTKSKRAKR